MLSRRTWRYFEVFVTAEENWLPPDNFQEHPAPVIASRTSPTNIGMALLANLAACDFGYCTVGRLLERTEQTLDTLGRMDRYRGHLYNWYDTRSLQPLRPHYVSTVDSGNLAGHVLVLRSGLLELAESDLLPSRAVGGLRDTVRVLLDVARGRERPGNGRGVPLVPADVLRKLERLEEQLESSILKLSSSPSPTRSASEEMPVSASLALRVGVSVSATATLLSQLVVDAGQIKAAATADNELSWWAGAFERSCIEHRDELLHLAPWAELPPLPDEVRRQRSPEHLQAIHDLDALLSRLQAQPSLREVAAMRSSLLPTLDGIMARLAVSVEWPIRRRDAGHLVQSVAQIDRRCFATCRRPHSRTPAGCKPLPGTG